MITVSVVKRYADAFYEFTKDTIGTYRAIEELKMLKRLLIATDDINKFLLSPAITYGEKCEFFDKALGNYVSRETIEFLKYILKKERVGEFVRIAEYVRLKYSHIGIEDSVLKASYPLDTETLQTIKDELETRLRKKLHIHMDLDPDLLGGIRVEVGNLYIDGSVKKRLDDLRKKLIGARVN